MNMGAKCMLTGERRTDMERMVAQSKPDSAPQKKKKCKKRCAHMVVEIDVYSTVKCGPKKKRDKPCDEAK